jgi:CheY-like chemotaxis protein
VTIEVTDTGIGMTNEQQSRIFDDFVQADASTTRRFGGTGLGMSIVRRLVNAMSGKIDLQSTPGMGTTVRVELPLELGDAKINDNSARTANRPRFDMRVLAADDTETNRTVLDALLRINGINAEIYGSGEEAIARFRESEFDLLLLDISMPGMDGVQTLHAIRELEAQEGRAEAPAVAVTANAFPHQIASYREAGFNDHLVKPLRSDALIGCIHRVLETSKRADLVS